MIHCCCGTEYHRLKNIGFCCSIHLSNLWLLLPTLLFSLFKSFPVLLVIWQDAFLSAINFCECIECTTMNCTLLIFFIVCHSGKGKFLIFYLLFIILIFNNNFCFLISCFLGTTFINSVCDVAIIIILTRESHFFYCHCCYYHDLHMNLMSVQRLMSIFIASSTVSFALLIVPCSHCFPSTCHLINTSAFSSFSHLLYICLFLVFNFWHTILMVYLSLLLLLKQFCKSVHSPSHGT